MENLAPIYSGVEDCPMYLLGRLKPPRFPDEESMQLQPEDRTVNGVRLPRQVVEELQRLGISLNWYNVGELTDAVIACQHDGQLVDDPHGVHFRDKMHLSEPEKTADGIMQYPHARMRVLRPKPLLKADCSEEDEKEKAAVSRPCLLPF